MLFRFRQIFSRIAGTHRCNLCKLELVGMVFVAGAVATLPNGYDIGVYVNGSMNTIETTNAPNAEQVIGCHNPAITGLTTKGGSVLGYATPIYIQDVSNVTYMRIILRDSLTEVDVGTIGGGVVEVIR